MPLTLKQAAAHLATTDYPYKLPTLRKAVRAKTLKTTTQTAGEIAYLTVELSDLMTWAAAQYQRNKRKPKGQPHE